MERARAVVQKVVVASVVTEEKVSLKARVVLTPPERLTGATTLGRPNGKVNGKEISGKKDTRTPQKENPREN